MLRFILILIVVVLAAGGAYWYFTSTGAGGGAVAGIKQRGTLIVGVRADSSPFARRNIEGEIVGFEPDLARDLGGRLGVELELKPVKDEDRVQVLQDGAVDLVLAGMDRGTDVGDLVRFVEPAYYAGGANVLIRAGVRLDEWKQLEGWPVCAVQGADYNEKVARNFGARIVVFRDASEALRAFDTGECRALLSDESWLISLLVQPEYADYELPLSHIEGRQWFVTIRHGQPQLHDLVRRAVQDWHSSGKIQELERQWNIRPSDFAARMHRGEAAAE